MSRSCGRRLILIKTCGRGHLSFLHGQCRARALLGRIFTGQKPSLVAPVPFTPLLRRPWVSPGTHRLQGAATGGFPSRGCSTEEGEGWREEEGARRGIKHQEREKRVWEGAACGAGAYRADRQIRGVGWGSPGCLVPLTLASRRQSCSTSWSHVKSTFE